MANQDLFFQPRSQPAVIFSGVNYLEALSYTEPSNLVSWFSKGGIEKTGTPVTATPDSIFNKFSVFQYGKFIRGSVYQPQAHFIGYTAEKNIDPASDALNAAELQNLIKKQKAAEDVSAALNPAATNYDYNKAKEQIASIIKSAAQQRQSIESANRSFAERNKSTLANPTASNIIEWAKKSMDSILGFQPYSMTDFMFCKNYGKIPNNRMVTLRRYPFPIDDRLRSDFDKNPIPIAQAVTWFGTDTENSLSNIGVLKWNLKWTSLTVTEQTIDGNEVTVNQLASFFEKLGKNFTGMKSRLEKTFVLLNPKNSTLQQISGMEEKMQKYQKELYSTNGPYWNRVFGPVNVIHQTTRRDRGMQEGWDTPFSLKFHYSFRSFNGLSPKIVALDLISHFLQLTYNDAQFLGQLARYWPKLGLKFDPTTTQLIGDLLTKWATSFNAGSMNEMMALAEKLVGGINSAVSGGLDALGDATNGDFKKLKRKGSQFLQIEAITALADAVPNLISIRSALSDRPVGEWHLVVGNPMNPIMVMGDLCCTGCDLKFDEEMGPDDFPTGCTFTVTLKQGKPRDKVAIEKMFNFGLGKLGFGTIRDPSSASDTFGPTNVENYDQLKKEITPELVKEVTESVPFSSFNKYRNRIRRSYGYAKMTDQPGTADDDSILWLYYDRGQHKT